jgi:2-polyprenyl-6-hydroxyphenyl methylase/3-demethylubiquinone-9 3-methyltransferase
MTMPAGPNADERFVDYYAEQSVSERTRQRIESVRRILLGLRAEFGLPRTSLDVLDVGCGAGAQALAWAREGHRARGVDISAPLIELAHQRAAAESLPAEFRVGSATELPYANGSADVLMVSELLEHLPNWEACLNEALRVLRPGGVLYLSTTNRLCPIQQEFALPLYSWYPARLKRHCEKLAVTTHGHWVQYASFPAVHWFTFYQLRDYLDARGVSARDRFDIMESTGSALRAAAVAAVRASAALRFLGHVLTPYTAVAGYKRTTAAPEH